MSTRDQHYLHNPVSADRSPAAEKNETQSISDQHHRDGGITEFSVTGKGPLLVYVAGLDGTGKLFFKQIDRLSETFRVATFRTRDRGQFTYSDLADDIADLIDRLGETKATILGESFGGTVALSFALAYPQMVERLIIVNSFCRYRKRVRLRLLKALASKLPSNFTWIVRGGGSRLGLFLDGVKGADRARVLAAIRTANMDGYLRRLNLIEQVDLEDRLNEISVPVMFLAAENDIVVPSKSEARLMAGKVRDSQLKIIARAGHACLLGDKVCLATIIKEWVSTEYSRENAQKSPKNAYKELGD